MINDSKAYELLGEIAKLLKKYEKDTFSNLATILRDPKLSNQIAEILENTAQLSPQKKRTRKRPSALEERTRFRESLVALGKEEPEKSKTLLLLFDSLQAKTILPSLRNLTDFISDQGMPVPKAKSREKVIMSFLKKCIEFSLHDLQAFESKINPQQPNDNADRSLEGWGRVILDRNTDKS